jgi:excisionase family DNA binding protein
MTPKPLTKKDLCEKYGVSLSTVDRWMAAGRITYFKFGGIVKFTETHIQAFEKAHTIKATI